MINALQWIQDTAFSTWLRESESLWALPWVLSVHAFGMATLAGLSWAIDLRLLGLARGFPLEPMRPMFRLMWLAFWVNAVSGALLFLTKATKMGTSIAFMIKMLFIALGMVALVRIKRNLYESGTGRPIVNGTTKLLAVASLIAWLAAITTGRLLAYITE
jgi:hypothetical protein